LSVATGTPFLGKYEVVQPGRVGIIQEEISDAEMKKRMRMIAVSKGLGAKVEKRRDDSYVVTFPQPLSVYLRNRQQFDLSKTECMDELLTQVKEYELRLLILDPLQLVLGSVNENQASEMRTVLGNLLKLKESTGCAPILIHHYAKESATNPRTGGQRLLGSQALHAWCESALYLSKDDKGITKVTREFRNFDNHGPFDVEYMGDDGRYEVKVTERDEKRRKPTVQKSEVKTPPTEFEIWVLNHSGSYSVSAVAKKLDVTVGTLRRRVQRSPWIDISVESKVGEGRTSGMLIRRK